MIAPLRPPPSTTRATASPKRLRAARELVARMLLPQRDPGAVPSLRAWKAWLIVGWMAIVATCYALAMLGIWP